MPGETAFTEADMTIITFARNALVIAWEDRRKFKRSPETASAFARDYGGIGTVLAQRCMALNIRQRRCTNLAIASATAAESAIRKTHGPAAAKDFRQLRKGGA